MIFGGAQSPIDLSLGQSGPTAFGDVRQTTVVHPGVNWGAILALANTGSTVTGSLGAGTPSLLAEGSLGRSQGPPPAGVGRSSVASAMLIVGGLGAVAYLLTR